MAQNISNLKAEVARHRQQMILLNALRPTVLSERLDRAQDRADQGRHRQEIVGSRARKPVGSSRNGLYTNIQSPPPLRRDTTQVTPASPCGPQSPSEWPLSQPVEFDAENRPRVGRWTTMAMGALA